MSLLPRKNWGSGSLIVALIAMLAVLGFLQYRSTQKVSDATARDMGESLQSALFDFRHALERELARVCLELQPSRGASFTASVKEISRRLSLWQQVAHHPDLVTEVFLWESASPGRLVQVYSNAQYRRAEWPAQLAGLAEQLEHAFPNGDVSADNTQPSEYRAVAGPPTRSKLAWRLDQEHLALVYPVSIAEGEDSPSVTWLVVPLQREFLAQHLLPELVLDHFRGRGQNYDVAVVADGASRSVLYSSDPGFGSDDRGAVDARLNLIGPPSIVSETLSFHNSGVVIPAGQDHQGDSPSMFVDPLFPPPTGPTLAVIAKHQKGSLEAAVASLRERNMALNFGVLGILAVTLTLVVITSHRARRLARMQMDFVAGVSHELRTPLTAILLAARNIEDGVVGGNGLVRYGAAIKSQAAQLSGLVEEILLFSETHSGQHIYKLEAIDIALGIENTLESLAPIIDSSAFVVERDVTSDLPPAWGDASAFSQCLQNLISNALKYGRDNQWIGVRAFLQESGGRKEICVSVADRGIGIRSAELKQIFEPFYRSAEVVGLQIHGNGLGLPLTKTMIEAMQGRLTVVSEAGEGSTFTMHLRAAGQSR
jgi:signal transduction histidine kinase